MGGLEPFTSGLMMMAGKTRSLGTCDILYQLLRIHLDSIEIMRLIIINFSLKEQVQFSLDFKYPQLDFDVAISMLLESCIAG